MRILLLDIETSPHVVYSWSLWPDSISPQNIVQTGYTLCWAAKWLGEKQIYTGTRQDSSESEMLEPLYRLLDEADVVVHYHGSKFDIPTLSKDFIMNGWNPFAPVKELDLLKVIKKRFRFPSNKLDYVATQLGLGSKVQHKGMELWRECMAGVPEAWDTMIKYNIQDVILLEKLYNRVLPWIPKHPNYGNTKSGKVCPSCGGTHLQKRGFSSTASGSYQRYSCSDCGSWSRERLQDKNVDKPIIVPV